MSVIADMQYHDYLESLLARRLVLRLVKTLISHPGKVFTVRKLAADAQVSPSEAAVLVQELEKYGIIRVQPVGRSYLITLNEQNYVLSKILRQIIKAEQETLNELISVLNRYFSNEKIISVVVFGSVAQKREHEDSDVDLLVISDDFDAAIHIISRAQDRISSVFNSRLSPIIMNTRELLKRKKSPLVRSIIANHKLIAGKSLKEIIGEL
jgi:predicted nucleotidyltransferase